MTPGLAIAIAGWTGAGLIVAAYALLTMGRMSSTSAGYQWLNVAGAAGIGINAWWNDALPSVALNIVWAGIGVVALWQIRRAAG